MTKLYRPRTYHVHRFILFVYGIILNNDVGLNIKTRILTYTGHQTHVRGQLRTQSQPMNRLVPCDINNEVENLSGVKRLLDDTQTYVVIIRFYSKSLQTLKRMFKVLRNLNLFLFYEYCEPYNRSIYGRNVIY